MTPINLFWMVSPNFGDALAPWLARRLSGRAPVYMDPRIDADKYVIGGSVLNHATPKCHAWGAGLASIRDGVDAGAQIYAVRGPISRAVARACGAACPPVYGDPALVLPRVYQPRPQARRYAVGVVPHFLQAHLVRSALAGTEHPDVRVLDIFAPVEEFIDALCSCDLIVSSALHGLVTANAYGIPAAWASFGESAIGGDGTKFRDYGLSVGVDAPDCVRLTSPDMLSDLAALQVLPRVAPRCDLDALVTGLLASCPFEVTP